MVGVSFGALAYAGAALPVGLPAASSLLVPRAWRRAILFGGKTLGWVYLAALLTLLKVAAGQPLRLRLILRCGLGTVGHLDGWVRSPASGFLAMTRDRPHAKAVVAGRRIAR